MSVYNDEKQTRIYSCIINWQRHPSKKTICIISTTVSGPHLASKRYSHIPFARGAIPLPTISVDGTFQSRSNTKKLGTMKASIDGTSIHPMFTHGVHACSAPLQYAASQTLLFLTQTPGPAHCSTRSFLVHSHRRSSMTGQRLESSLIQTPGP